MTFAKFFCAASSCELTYNSPRRSAEALLPLPPFAQPTVMAVIQDLPREILRRILELGAGDPTCLKGRDLYSTALVARAWSQPSQELLVSLWWIPYLPKAPQYDTSPPPTRRLLFVTVYSPTTTAQIRRLFERHGTQLTHLDMHGSCETSDLMFLLVHGTLACSRSE